MRFKILLIVLIILLPCAILDENPSDNTPSTKKEINETKGNIAVTVTDNITNNDINTRIVLGVVVVLLINLIASIMLHSNGKITIYSDYTDAALTFAWLLLPLIVCSFAALAKFEQPVIFAVTGVSIFLAGFFIFRSTYVNNTAFIYVIMAFFAKIFAITLYALFLITAGGTSAKREGESDTAYEIRKAAAQRSCAIHTAVLTGIFLYLTRAMTRKRCFSPVFEHISVSFVKISLVFIFLACSTRANAEIVESIKTKAIALTFDACETSTPSYFDEKILSYLIREQIPFTVFMTGKFAIRNSERVKEIAKLPFVEIENHSFNHQQHMERLSADAVKKEVSDLDNLMKTMTGKKTKYFRFPGGNYDSNVLKLVEGMNYKVVHWTFPSGDPDKKVTPEKLTNWVVSKAKPGNVLIFHINGRGHSTGEALPSIVNTLRKKGIKFVKLEDGGL